LNRLAKGKFVGDFYEVSLASLSGQKKDTTQDFSFATDLDPQRIPKAGWIDTLLSCV
jgi:hypothetical protein